MRTFHTRPSPDLVFDGHPMRKPWALSFPLFLVLALVGCSGLVPRPSDQVSDSVTFERMQEVEDSVAMTWSGPQVTLLATRYGVPEAKVWKLIRAYLPYEPSIFRTLSRRSQTSKATFNLDSIAGAIGIGPSQAADILLWWDLYRAMDTGSSAPSPLRVVGQLTRSMR